MDKFKAEVGRLILVGACGYCALLTVVLIVTTYFKCEPSQPVRDILIIILVVDHQYGTSASSETKSDFMMTELKKKEDAAWVKPPEEPEPPKPSA